MSLSKFVICNNSIDSVVIDNRKKAINGFFGFRPTPERLFCIANCNWRCSNSNVHLIKRKGATVLFCTC